MIEKRSGLALIVLLALGSALPAGPGSQSGNLTDRDYRNGVLRKVADIVEGKYVLADRAKGFADAFRAKCASGSYDASVQAGEFAERVNADLVAITGDKHLNFRVIVPSSAGEKPSSSLHHPVRYYLLRKKENAGFTKLEWIEAGIGYLELRRFNSFGEARALAIAAMTFLSNARAIIIDVRENGGGSGDYLSSYFLPYPTQLSGSYSRLDGRLSEIWTIRDIGMEPRTDVPLFILTGPNTFSAAEAFAYDLKTRKRATIVGEPTKGGAHSVDLFGIDDRFEFVYLDRAGGQPGHGRQLGGNRGHSGHRRSGVGRIRNGHPGGEKSGRIVRPGRRRPAEKGRREDADLCGRRGRALSREQDRIRGRGLERDVRDRPDGRPHQRILHRRVRLQLPVADGRADANRRPRTGHPLLPRLPHRL